MKPNASRSHAFAQPPGPSLVEVIERTPMAPERRSSLEWWYRRTAPDEPSSSAPLKQREAYRRGRLIATILLMQMGVIVLVALTVGLFVNRLLLPNLVVTLLVLCGAAWANRRGRVIISGLLSVIVLEISIGLNIFFNPAGLSVFALPFYDILVIGELFAVSLLPEWAVFLAAFINILFIGATLGFLPKADDLAAVLNGPEAVDALARPIAIQIMVAVVSYLWVRSAKRAIERADRATTIAALEHALAQQGQEAALQKQQLEQSIQQIIDTHTRVANGDLSARVPLTQDNVLWEVAGLLNNVLSRLQRLSQTEAELQRNQQVAAYFLEMLRQSQGRPIAWPRTGTIMDAIALQYNALVATRSGW